MGIITEEQYEELCEARGFDRDKFHKLLSEYCDIEIKPYTAYAYYDVAGNYIGNSDDSDVRDLLNNAYVEIQRNGET